MEPGVGKNSLLLVWRFHAGIIKRGDLVVVKVKHPITHESIIILKRVIGLPGETVKIKNGISSIRGVEWIDQYGMVSDFGDSPYIKDDFEVNLLGDEIFVLGDNRRRSIDSRYYGPVKISDIKYYDPVIIWR
jgi:signal peptidase I